MWKDFFYFSKGQQFGIIVLLALIVLVTAVNSSLPFFFSVHENSDDSFLREAEEFKKSLFSRDSQFQVNRQRDFEDKYKKNGFKQYEKENRQVTLFLFDPNTADSATLLSLGIKPYAISNLLKYRSKGGRFRGSEDLGKVFGISTQKLDELKPFVTIKQIAIAKPDSIANRKSKAMQSVVVELNSADTTLLMQVKGIGRGYAKGIVNFRRKLGGFTSVEQLKEVYGMRPENYERIVPFCRVSLDLIQKIRVNIATAEKLNSHPYLNFYQAKAIYELRRSKGRLHSVNDLKSIPELTTEDLKRVEGYLSFE
jgi:competence protein ComEA